MTAIDITDAAGKKTGSAELPAQLFDVETNVALIHQVVVAQRAAARQGTHKAKNRGEVSGSGRKPFKQKGTGNARQGSIRMPQHRGGGTVHTPVPRNYAQRTPKKMIAAALLQLLSDRARQGRLHVVDSLVEGETPSTAQAAAAIATVTDRRSVLVVLTRDDELSIKSVRNLEGLHGLYVDQLNAYDVVVADDVLFTKAAFDEFVESKTRTAEPRQSASAATAVSSAPETVSAAAKTEAAAIDANAADANTEEEIA